MKAIPQSIPDVILFEPDVYKDQRGFFFESFNQSEFEKHTGCNHKFVQDNHSHSIKNVLRGLHYQLPPKAQGKLVRVTQGEIFDVAVDIRRSSITYGQWVGTNLSAENKLQLWIPEGFAHGFLTKSDITNVLYKTTEYYSPEHERCILWNDNNINIDWPFGKEPTLSEKDRQGISLDNAEVFV